MTALVAPNVHLVPLQLATKKNNQSECSETNVKEEISACSLCKCCDMGFSDSVIISENRSLPFPCGPPLACPNVQRTRRQSFRSGIVHVDNFHEFFLGCDQLFMTGNLLLCK